jgi:hypothetical protein
MPRLNASQRQVQAEFLQQVRDGRLDRPVAEGSGLPNLAYTCADFFQLEQQTVFRNNWVFAGFRHRKLLRSDTPTQLRQDLFRAVGGYDRTHMHVYEIPSGDVVRCQ